MSPVQSPPALTIDRSGFPEVAFRAGCRAGLLPVARVQIEAFLGAVPGLDADLIAAFVGTATRVSWRSPRALERIEAHFATGLLPEERSEFARWMGASYRLPTAEDWRALDAFAMAWSDVEALRSLAADEQTHPAARAMLNARLERNASVPEVMMLESGILEWVTLAGGEKGLLGRPRPGLYRVVHNPQRHEPIRPRPGLRHSAFGFRLVSSVPS